MKRHWTCKYIRSRAGLYYYEMTHPGRPWWTKDAVELMDQLIRSEDSVLEFGAGRSTIWLGKRCSEITSVEHDNGWADNVSRMADAAQIRLSLLKPAIRSTIWSEFPEEADSYLQVLERGRNKFDVIIIDGLFRDLCSIRAAQNVKPGGILLIDNVNWYLPSDSGSPSSIPPDASAASSAWIEFMSATDRWRKIITSNGVTDTAIFFAPLVD